MNNIKERLKEKSLLFLYVLSKNQKSININTFRRYIYLYYLSGKLFDEAMDEITISIDKGDMKIAYLEEALEDFDTDELIDIQGNQIVVLEELKNKVDFILNQEKENRGTFYEIYRSIKPFATLLSSYDEQFIFTIFFSEPTFQDANERGVSEMSSSDSRLSQLLIEFKKQVNDTQIDNYDILTHWMDFVLKNYYQ